MNVSQTIETNCALFENRTKERKKGIETKIEKKKTRAGGICLREKLCHIYTQTHTLTSTI